MELECKIGELGHPNRNGMIYPKDVIEKAIQDYNNKEYKFGEIGDNITSLNVDLQHISHKVNEIKLKDDNLCVNIELLDTPSGNIAKELINAGHKLNIKPRMLINKEKVKKGPGKHSEKEVITEMNIISFDIVL